MKVIYLLKIYLTENSLSLANAFRFIVEEKLPGIVIRFVTIGLDKRGSKLPITVFFISNPIAVQSIWEEKNCIYSKEFGYEIDMGYRYYM